MRNLCDVNRGQALTGSYSTKLQGNREWGSRRPTSPHSTPPVGMGNREWGIGEEDLPTPHPTAPPLGIGNREWGIEKAVRPLPPHPYFIKSRESASPFPIPHSHDSPFPIADSQGRGGGGRWGVGRPLPSPRQCARHGVSQVNAHRS